MCYSIKIWRVGQGPQAELYEIARGGSNVNFIDLNSVLSMQRHRPNVKICNHWGVLGHSPGDIKFHPWMDPPALYYQIGTLR